MTQRRKHHDSAAPKDASQQLNAGSTPTSHHGAAALKNCAYNRTTQRFLSAEVDTGDFSSTSLDARLPALAAQSGTGLWLIPFRGISLTSVRVPVDLIYLDPNFTVLAVVESFPIGRLPDSSTSAASVLVLAADTICSSETQPGDQLILCAPDEMKIRLRESTTPSAEPQPEPPPAPVENDSVSSVAGRLLRWKNRSRQESPVEAEAAPIPNPITPVAPAYEELPSQAASWVHESEETDEIEPAQESVKPARSWLQRFLDPEPPEPRQNLRESLPGLSAYFFTGGAPQEHGVRDISPTGMYVFTEERWYPGTVIRMTLTHRAGPTAERSITLNVMVVRCCEDGVGLAFVFQSNKDRRQRKAGGIPDCADKTQVDQFLQQLKNATGQGAD